MRISRLLQALVLSILQVQQVSASAVITKRGPTCQNITIPVTISSTNAQLPIDLDSSEALESILTDVVGIVFDVLIQGTFTIAASYCEPEVHIASRSNTLQLLVHGATYDRYYWSGEGAPGYSYEGDKYSWVAYASQQGYPTLAIDRLGYGLSEHPDPILHVQFPTHVEIAHGIVEQARAGASPFPRAFDQVIYVGHSFGSLVGNLFNEKYPDDVDATILTGWSSDFVLPGVPIALGLVTLPAPLVDPAEFGDLSVGYVMVTSEQGEINAFYYAGAYDPALEALDFATRQTIALGELATFAVATTEASGYTAPIFVVTANDDAIFCSPALGLLPPSCGTGPENLLAASGTLYPHASVYDYYILEDAGHCWHLHYVAQEGFRVSHDWLEKQGF